MRYQICIGRLALLGVSLVAMGLQQSTLAADPTTQPATAPSTITWDTAAKHVGETATVTGPVKGTHVAGNKKSLILNVGKDYPDKGRFSILISTDPKSPISEDTYKDKTVTVTGKIELYRGVPEIKVNKAEDVTVSKE